MRLKRLYTCVIAVSALLFCIPGNRAFAQDSLHDGILASFKAGISGNASVQLSWMLNSEREDSLDFFIERSRDGVAFQSLSKITAHSGEKEFRFTDNLPLTDSGFYRLAWIDITGSKGYSGVQKVQFAVKPKTEITIMPNPVFNNACLIINHEEVGDITCILFDMSGKNIRSYQLKKTAAYMQYILDMYSVPRGEYILSIRGNTINESKRIVKQ
ncbi:MAG: T9SS type A sorting domain-containing protein [Chitinophagaceae bacterium]|nr:T9SS type A sorting domain-containing protein [Chitinophagaceae bacterium]